MENENKNNNNEIDTTALHNLMFFIIIILLVSILYFSYHTFKNTAVTQNIGSLQHYDSLYSERDGHISINQSGNIIGYSSPDGTKYIFETPISPDVFYY